ncbi:leukotriene B4 receptor 1-like protein [Labeo rohita]|uniref:Leukotriene B4 receptor 1-like protein n=1 Tax=Labeo rohita TaxID=84645 RepID=A0A498MMG0_LABRO|nr:leukotriene B4 receptor 1-like protein [Labeo rohita]
MSVHSYHNVIKSRVTNRMILQRLERRHRRLQLIGIWTLAFAFALPVYFVQGLGLYKDGLQTCTRTTMESQSVEVTVLLFEILLGFIIPFLTMLTCYLWLHKGLSQKAKNSGVTTAPQDQEPRNQGTNVRTYKKRLVISIVVAFFVFWTPVHIINVIDIFTTLTKTSHPDVHCQLKSFRRVYSDTNPAFSRQQSLMMELRSCINSTSNSTTVVSQKIAPAVVLGLCCLVGLPSNIVVIISIAREWNRNLSFTLKLMINLAVSDALTLCVVPFVLYGILFGWIFSLWSCKFLFFLGHWSLYVGILTVTSMSVHRYHNVIKSRVTNRMILQRLERRHRHLQLIAIWILAFAFALPVIFTHGVNDVLQRCQRTVDSQSAVVTVLLFEILLGFIIPFLTMLTSYLWLDKGLKQKAKRSSLTTAPQDQEPRNQGTNVRTYKKRLVISIVVAFFVLWTPVHIINVIDLVTALTKTSHPDVHCQLKSFRQRYGDTNKTLALLNCCLNPFLYAMSSGNLMKCFRKR